MAFGPHVQMELKPYDINIFVLYFLRYIFMNILLFGKIHLKEVWPLFMGIIYRFRFKFVSSCLFFELLLNKNTR
jgi:hypothetical protein